MLTPIAGAWPSCVVFHAMHKSAGRGSGLLPKLVNDACKGRQIDVRNDVSRGRQNDARNDVQTTHLGDAKMTSEMTSRMTYLGDTKHAVAEAIVQMVVTDAGRGETVR